MRRRWSILLLGILGWLAAGCAASSGGNADRDQRGGFYGGVDLGHSTGGDGGLEGGGM